MEAPIIIESDYLLCPLTLKNFSIDISMLKMVSPIAVRQTLYCIYRFGCNCIAPGIYESAVLHFFRLTIDTTMYRLNSLGLLHSSGVYIWETYQLRVLRIWGHVQQLWVSLVVELQGICQPQVPGSLMMVSTLPVSSEAGWWYVYPKILKCFFLFCLVILSYEPRLPFTLHRCISIALMRIMITITSQEKIIVNSW